jgi:hypothetical protein
VQRIAGRERTPESYIFYAGVFTAVSMAILWPVLHFLRDAGPLAFAAWFCVATTIGQTVAQSFFGRKRAVN